MKQPMFALLAVLTCATLAPPAVRAADGPDLKETLTWLKRYLNEEAGGQYGPDLPADAPSGLTGASFARGYVWIDKTWTSPEEATIDFQQSLVFRSSNTTSQAEVSLKLKDLDPNKLSVGLLNKVYFLKIYGNEAVTYTRLKDGSEATLKSSKIDIMFPTEDAAKKACRALRRAAVLAGATETADPFTADSPKSGVTSTPADSPTTTPLPPTPPPAPVVTLPPDDKVARRAALDADIAAAGDAVSQGQQMLTELNGKILGAKLVLVAANAAYQNAESGSLDEIVAGAAVVAAQSAVDDLEAQKDGVASDLKADRDRYNQLMRDRAKLGN